LDDFDTGLMGKNWTADETSQRADLPGRLKMVDGNLCLGQEQRMMLLGALLEKSAPSGLSASGRCRLG
jgi:hypothetical protein